MKLIKTQKCDFDATKIITDHYEGGYSRERTYHKYKRKYLLSQDMWSFDKNWEHPDRARSVISLTMVYRHSIINRASCGYLEQAYWRLNNDFHRQHHAAVFWYNLSADEQKTLLGYEAWSRYGQCIRQDSDLPISIHYHEDGAVHMATWLVSESRFLVFEGLYMVKYDKDGAMLSVEHTSLPLWLPDGPNGVEFSDGEITSEKWAWIEGGGRSRWPLLHREDAPAMIEYEKG